MQAAFALLPPAIVLVAVLGFRASGLQAAAAAAIAAALVWAAGIFLPASSEGLHHAGADAAVLTVLVAAMIVPGVLFVEATRSRKSPEAIGALVGAIGLPKPRAAILVATGIGVMVESLTGMGVSLLVTMPLLLRQFSKPAAIGIGLVGMSLMPWGALAISAHVGAGLSGMTVEVLQGWISVVSGAVAFCLPTLCLIFAGPVTPADRGIAILAGFVLAGSIAVASHAIGVEVAGVAGGLAVIGFMVVLARARDGIGHALAAPGFVPYAMLIGAVLVQKLAVVPLAATGLSPALDTGRVRFALLTSPGVALLAATALTAASAITTELWRSVAGRVWRPVAAIALYMLAARLLVECGAIAALADSLKGLGRDGALIAVGLLGAVGGFVTGSGVTGNALFMPSAAEAGKALGVLPVFAALQNGASGHVGMASLPVAAIMIATLTGRQDGDDALVMRTALALAAGHVLVATLAALVLLRIAY